MLCFLEATFNSERSEDAAACEFGAENRGRSDYRRCDSWLMVATGSNFVHELPTSTETLFSNSFLYQLHCLSYHSLLVMLWFFIGLLESACSWPNDSLGMTGRCSRDVGNTKAATPTKTLQATVCSRGSRALMTRRTFGTEYWRWHLISHHEIQKVHGSSPRPFFQDDGAHAFPIASTRGYESLN